MRPPLALIALSLMLAAGADAQEVRAARAADGASLGSVAPPASCAPDAMLLVDRGIALLHNMTYELARPTFAEAAAADPGCALAMWGEAMTYVHPLWPDVPTAGDLARARALLAEARAGGPLADPLDAYVSALEAYLAGDDRPEADRLADFAAGWEEARTLHPDDPEIELFGVLAQIAVAGDAPDPVAARSDAGERAEAVLAEIPDHTGALHYVIHAYDHPALAERAVASARVYGEIAPQNVHALHMTSHIFTRVGEWTESERFNRRSAEVAMHHPMGDATSYHYFHAADYLVYASLQRLDDASAWAVWEEMAAIEGPVADHLATAYPYAAVPARLALERRDWAAARAIRPRWPASVAWDRHPQAEAIAVFAHGLGAVHGGDLDGAAADLARLIVLKDAAAALPGAYDWATQVGVQVLTLEAWTSHAAGDDDRALRLMRDAVDLETPTEKNPVTPAEVVPAAEFLGDLLLAVGRPAEAAEAYEAALVRAPNRFNSLRGAGAAHEAAGDLPAARRHYAALVALAGETDHEAVAHARHSLAGRLD